MRRITAITEKIFGLIGVILFLLMGIIGIIQIVVRADFIPISSRWSEESIRYLIILLTAVGVPYATNKETHVSIRPLVKLLPSSYFRVMILISYIAAITISLIIMISGIIVSERTLGQELLTISWLTVGYAHIFIALMFSINAILCLIKLYEYSTVDEPKEKADVAVVSYD